jgi:hypothetical protein
MVGAGKRRTPSATMYSSHKIGCHVSGQGKLAFMECILSKSASISGLARAYMYSDIPKSYRPNR